MSQCFITKPKRTSKKCKIIWLTLLLICLLSGIVYTTVFLERHESYSVQTYLNQPLPFSKDIALIRYFDKRGFDFTAIPNKTALWTEDIQLCIMFNTVIKNRIIGLLLSYYLQFFNHITLISGTKVLHAKPSIVPDSVQVLNCQSYYGRHQQKCIRTCLENPASDSVEGFLYIADDMFINISKMGQLDRDKLWTIPIEVYNYTRLIRAGEIEKHLRWSWFGFPRYVEFDLQRTMESLPEEWIESLKTNAGFPDEYETSSTADIYYIPALYAPKMIEVMSFIINTTDLFNEVALPLTIGVTTHPSQRETLIDGYLWKFDRTLSKKASTAKIAHFVHPMKLSHSDEATLWISLMKEQLRQAVAL